MTARRGFRTSEVVKLTGLTRRRLDYWDRTGFVKPSLAAADGRGSSRFYSFRDVVQLKVAKELRDAGVPLQTLRKVVARLADCAGLEDPLAETRLVVSGGDVLLVRGRDDLVSLLQEPGQRVLHIVLDLPRVVNGLRAGVEGLQGSIRSISL